MFDKVFLDRIKHSAIVMSFGLVLAVVPFYFQTKAMTENNNEDLTEQSEIQAVQGERLKALEIQGAVYDAEIEQVKESLARIEKKIDRLIERN
jgi:uncharacterized membrane protein